MSNHRVVPSVAEWLLGVVLPRGVRDALLSDLAAAAANPRRVSPRLWYWRQTLSALWPPTLIALHLDTYTGAPMAAGRSSSLASIGADLRFTGRRMRRRPALAAAIVVLLTLGVTSGAAVFSIFSELLHPRIGVPDADKLYTLALVDSTGYGNSTMRATWIDAVETAAKGKHFFASAAREGVVRYDAAPVSTRVALVSSRYFDLVGVRPVLGRTPVADRAEALVSYHLWNQLLAGDPNAVGKVVTINRQPYMIAGIAPPAFDGPENGLIWIPASVAAANQPRRPALGVFARIDDARDVPALVAAVGPSLLRNVIADAPGTRPPTVRLTRLSEATDRSETPVLRDASRILGLLSLLVLIAACANTANVLAMDVFERAPELALRSAIGGSRWQILRQLLCEYGVYGMLAVFVAIAASFAAIRSMPLWLPIDEEWASRLSLRAGSTLLVVAAVALSVALAVAVPMRRAMRILSALRSVGISRTGAGRSVGALVSVQVAQTVVLLTAAVTLWRSEAFIRNKPLGFDARSSAVFLYSLPRAQYDSARAIRFEQDLLRALATTLGGTAAIGAPVPLIAQGRATLATVGGTPIEARTASVSSSYFAAMGTRVVEGRAFDGGTEPRIVVSRTLATALFPTGSAIGRGVRVTGDSALYVVSGVVEDGTYGGVDPVPYVFMPASRRPLYVATIVVRSARPRRELATAIAAAARAIDPDVPVTTLGSLATLLDRARLLSVMMRGLALAFCALAIVVSAVGLFVHLARYVSARTAELGLRIALGASPARMMRDVVSHCGRLTAVGLLAGGVVSVWATSWLSTVAFGVRRADPVVIGCVVGTAMLIALVAAAVPSWRAAHVDPARALSGSTRSAQG